MLNKVVLPYTIWYTGLEKILRLNLDKGIDAVTNISTKATLNGTSVNDLVSAIFNPKNKSIDITIISDARMDVDGEMEISLSYSDAKTHESILVVSVRSHENTATENPKEVKQTKLTLLNGQSHTVGAADEQVVYSFDLVDRNVTDEFATYGDVKDMLIGLGVTDSGEKDQYTISLEGDNLVLSKENDPSYRKVINLAKYHDEVSGEPLNVEDLKRDILSIVDGKLPNFEMLMNDILAEAVKKDAQLKVDILHEVDGKIPNGDTIKQEILADVNPRIPDKETLKTEILESAGEKDAALKTTILEEVGTRTTQNNQSLKQEIMGEVDGKIPNTAVLKEDILGEVDTKITTNNQTFKSTVMSEVDSKIPDVSVVKSEILNEVTPRLLDKETLKQEILSAVPTPANYTLTMEEDNLVLGKEGDASYRKVINLAKYRDEVAGSINDLHSFINALEMGTDGIRSHYASEILYSSNLSAKLTDQKDIEIYNNSSYFNNNGDKVSNSYKILTISHTILSSQNVDVEQLKRDIIAAIHVPDENAIKQNILAEVNPKLIDKDSFKTEVLAAVPTHKMTAVEILDTLAYYEDEGVFSKFLILAGQLLISLSDENRLVFRKTETAYEIVFDADGIGGASPLSTSILTIPFTSLREIPTATQAEPVTLEKIFELLNDDSKANVLEMIKNKLDIPEPVHPVKLISEPSVTNGVLKFNTEDQSPTVDFTNDFYTKAKVDALLSTAAPSGPIEGHGRPDKKAELNNAKIGTTYVDLDKTDGAYIWMKKSKWVVIEGDTGEVEFNQSLISDCKIRRINNTIIITPKVTMEPYIKRQVFYINNFHYTDNTTMSSKATHSSKKGFAPMVGTVIPITWIYDVSQSQRVSWDAELNNQPDKYIAYSGRFMFDKSIDPSELDILFQPDFGVFPNSDPTTRDDILFKVDMANNDAFVVLAQNFIYETDSDWPELSN